MASKRVVKLPVESARSDVKTFIPLGIAEGRRPGPTLAVIGGVHASEYAARESAVRLWQSLDPEELSGTVLVVLAADVTAYWAHHIYTNPVDGKNLNRSFPGNKDGTLSEVLAYTLTEEVVNKADVIIDCHGGEFDEYMAPYLITPLNGDPELDKKSLDLSYALGFPFIEVTDASGAWLGSNTLVGSAVVSGRVGMGFEVGDRGKRDERAIAAGYNSLQNALKHLGMKPGEPLPWSGAPVWLDRGIIVLSKEGGVFERSVMIDEWVEQGDLLGRVLDYDGSLLEEVRAPEAGVVLTVVASPAVKRGGFVAKIGVVRREQEK